MSDYHVSVLLKDVIENLKVEKGKKYIDATLGGGGYTFEIARLGGRVLGIDVDEEAIDYVESRIKNQELSLRDSIKIVKGNFRNIDEIAKSNGFENVEGIVFDLGVSMHQLKNDKRGFSFMSDSDLDMRMDRDLGVKAKDLINVLNKKELYEIFKNFGEESSAWPVAEAIISARKVKKIETTGELANIVARVVRNRNSKIHPATKIFQALRIVINDELGSLEEALPKAVSLLNKKGKLLVVSFHSGEDRIVKNSFKEFEKLDLGRIITSEPIVPEEQEIEINKASRSAKLRIFERL